MHHDGLWLVVDDCCVEGAQLHGNGPVQVDTDLVAQLFGWPTSEYIIICTTDMTVVLET